MSLIGLLFFGIIIYFLFKNLGGIFGEIFGTPQRHQTNNPADNQNAAAKDSKSDKNKIVKEDEGEYVDFEEIKDDKKSH